MQQRESSVDDHLKNVQSVVIHSLRHLKKDFLSKSNNEFRKTWVVKGCL